MWQLEVDLETNEESSTEKASKQTAGPSKKTNDRRRAQLNSG
jgi:hypothetical protein